MLSGKGSIVIPVLIITLGVGQLLSVKNVLPGVNWVWVLGLAVAGILILAVSGLNKVSVVLGPFLLLSALCAVMRQLGQLSLEVELPLLFIIFGTLMLLARFLPLGMPDWIRD